MMNNQLWMVFATKTFPEHILQVLDIHSCGFVPSMGMHMDFTSYKVVKGTRTLLSLYKSTWKHHQKMYFMTLHANYQNIALTGNQNYLRTQGSGMTFVNQLTTSVEFLSNQVGFVDWRE